MKRKSQEKPVGKNSQPVGLKKKKALRSRIAHEYDLHNGRSACY